MRPKYTTSYRPHGKWGDFFACIIPVSWCINILINSNFILRLIEWQNESSLFTIRVRGRQWYWVYKFELKNFTDILSTPKNVGSNKWLINVFGDLQTSEDYHHVLQLRSQNKWVKTYWAETVQKGATLNKNHIVLPQEQVRFDLFDENIYNQNIESQSKLVFSTLDSLNTTNSFNLVNYLSTLKNSWSKFDLETENDSFFLSEGVFDFFYDNNVVSKKESNLNTINFFNFLTSNSDNLSNSDSSYLLNSDFSESSLAAKRSSGPISPVRLIKNPLLTDNFSEQDVELFRLRFNEESSSIQHKVLPHTTYLTIKQKRYKRKKNIGDTKKFFHDENEGKTKRVRFSL